MKGSVLLVPVVVPLIFGQTYAGATEVSPEPLRTTYQRAVTAESDCVRDAGIKGVSVSAPRASADDPSVLVYFVSVDARTATAARSAEAAVDAAQARCASISGSATAAARWFAVPWDQAPAAVAITPYNGDFMTWSHNAGYTLLGIDGTGLIPGPVIVAHAHGDGYGTICNFKAKIWGTKQSGAAYSQTSSLVLKCIPIRVGIDMNPVNTAMKSGSGFYGQFYEDGAWVPGIPMATMHA